jgi:hypothetical protein
MKKLGIVIVFLLGAVAGAVLQPAAEAGAEDSLKDAARSLEGIRDELRSIRRDGIRVRVEK